MAKFSDVLTIINGKNQGKVENPNGRYPIYGSGGIMGYADSYLCKPNTVVIGRKGNINKPIFVETPFWNVDTAFGLEAKTDVLLPKYLYYFCVQFDFEKLNTTVTIPSLTKANLLQIDIPVPSIDEQREIVDSLDKVERLIFLRKKQLQKLDDLIKSRFVEMFGDPKINPNNYDIKKISELFDVGSSKRVFESEWRNSGVPFYRAREIVKLSKDGFVDNELFIDESMYVEYKRRYGVPKENDMMVTGVGTLGICYVVKGTDKFYFKDGNILWFKNKGLCDVRFIKDQFETDFVKDQIVANANISTVGTYTITNANNTLVLVPPISEQYEYVTYCNYIDKQKTMIQQGLDKLEQMKQALMQKYFG